MERERLLIDTSILIDHLRKPRKDNTIFYRAALRYDCVISVITEFEFVVGATPKNRQFAELLLLKLPVLSFDSAFIQIAATIYRQLKTLNQLVALPDLFISATALTHDLRLLTLNRKHFERIENLNLYDPLL